MRSPIVWFGGKGLFTNTLLTYIPDHSLYVEVFGGAASLLFAKQPATAEVYNDIDSGLADFFRVIRDEKLFAQFSRFVQLSPYSRELFYEARQSWQDEPDLVKRVGLWFIVARQSFSGEFGASWSYGVTAYARKVTQAVSRWLTALDNLPAIHRRLQRVQIEQNDWETILDTYDRPETFFYLDPPYLANTRRGGKYAHEMTDDDHAKLVERIQDLRGKVLLSGYDNPIYAQLDNAGWQRDDIAVSCAAAGRTKGTGLLGDGATFANDNQQRRIETLWYNYRVDPNEQLSIGY